MRQEKFPSLHKNISILRIFYTKHLFKFDFGFFTILERITVYEIYTYVLNLG
jgi:hypothetical protein